MIGLVSNAASAAGGVADRAFGSAAKVVPSADGDADHHPSSSVQGAAFAAGHAVVGAAGSAASAAAAKAVDVAMDQKQRAANLVQQLRALLEAWVKQKLQAQAERLVDKLPGVAKSSLEDPEMPRCVSRGKDRAIDSMWPDLRTEIMWEVVVLLDAQKEDAVNNAPGVDCFRAFFRYHLFPFDKSFWGKLRDPFYVLFMLIPLVPVYGVTQIWFFFVFLIIDKSDEFQLIQFILSFKGMQFISHGVIRAVTGFFIFMMCVTAEADDHEHSCAKSGPGSGGDVWFTFAGFVFQVVLVWVAFSVLRCSKAKGKSVLKGAIAVDVEGSRRSPGGYISYFLWYDLMGFLLSMSIVVYAIATQDYEYSRWPVEHSVFAAQVVYGFVSMPFFLFTLPVLQRMLTHALPTAYDRQGCCRKPVKPPDKCRQQPKVEELVSEAEVNHLYTKIRALLPMP